MAKVLHIIDPCTRGRAAHARLAFELGYHAEIYDDVEEFMNGLPADGVVLIHDMDVEGADRHQPNKASESPIEGLAGVLFQRALWLPIVGMADKPRPRKVVEAIEAGAVDYMALPLRRDRLEEALARAARHAAEHGEKKFRAAEARRRIESLTRREREVLDHLVKGESNKMIGRDLGISPRTVEIHRANMMHKLGAGNASEAVLMRLEARLNEPVGSPPSAPAAPQAAAAGVGTGRPHASAASPDSRANGAGKRSAADGDDVASTRALAKSRSA